VLPHPWKMEFLLMGGAELSPAALFRHKFKKKAFSASNRVNSNRACGTKSFPVTLNIYPTNSKNRNILPGAPINQVRNGAPAMSYR